MITLISTKTNKQLCFNLLLDLEPVLWALIVAGVGGNPPAKDVQTQPAASLAEMCWDLEMSCEPEHRDLTNMCLPPAYHLH